MIYWRWCLHNTYINKIYLKMYINFFMVSAQILLWASAAICIRRINEYHNWNYLISLIPYLRSCMSVSYNIMRGTVLCALIG